MWRFAQHPRVNGGGVMRNRTRASRGTGILPVSVSRGTAILPVSPNLCGSGFICGSFSNVVNWLQNSQPPQRPSLTPFDRARNFTKFTLLTSFSSVSLTPPTHPLRIASAMSDPYIQSLFADRIGGKNYGKGTEVYKFEKIKRARRAAAGPHPGVVVIVIGVGEPGEMGFSGWIDWLSEGARGPEKRGYSGNGGAGHYQR